MKNSENLDEIQNEKYQSQINTYVNNFERQNWELKY